MDKWNEIGKLAEEAGFIISAYGGIMVLMSHEEQKDRGIFEEIQKMNNREEK